MKKELEKMMDDSILAFDKEFTQTKIFYPEFKGVKFFVKVAGEGRAKYIINEINSLKKLKDISPFYKNYYIGYKKKNGKVAIMLRYVSGIDLYSLIKSRKMVNECITNLYKILLKKIKLFHDRRLNHGDIKPQNLYAYINDNEEIDIEYIDTESVNDFNQETKEDEGYNNVISSKYDFPYKIKRSRILFKDKDNAFSFYKYLDLYSISVFIFYLYKKEVYKKLKNDTETPWIVKEIQKTPLDYLDKNKNKLEKALCYVFEFLRYVSSIEKTNDVKNIPISTTELLKILE